MAEQKAAKLNRVNKYLKEKVSVVFERLMIEILGSTPDDVIDWSINWLNTKGRKIVDAQKTTFNSEYKDDPSEDEEDDYIDVIPLVPTAGPKPHRNSVSAECFGSFNKKKAFKARVIIKEAIQTEKITQRLMQSFMFQALEDNDRNIVINAMEQKNFSKGDWIIKQGEDGDELYVLDSGSLDCFKKFSPDAQDTYLKTYQPGESFGELSLLYNAPRAASIQAKEDSICFALDRDTFNNIVKESTVKKREHYTQVIKKVDFFKDFNPYQIIQIVDAVVPQVIKKGEYVIKQGDDGNKFYIIEEGSLKATKNLPNGKEEQVFQFNFGDYFGEIALIKNVPRQANIIATTDGKLVHIERGGFNRLFGSMKDKLEKNLSKYKISNI